PEWRPGAAWDPAQPPLRPILAIAEQATPGAICEVAAQGVAELTASSDFEGVTDLKFDVVKARSLCQAASDAAVRDKRYFGDLCAALISDVAKDPEGTKVEPTPLAYPSVATSNFLKNFLALSKAELPERRSRDSSYPKIPAECISQALFAPWRRLDRPVGLR